MKKIRQLALTLTWLGVASFWLCIGITLEEINRPSTYFFFLGTCLWIVGRWLDGNLPEED